MNNMNQWIGEGNISCDPELRYTADNSKSVTNFNLYVDSKFKNKNQSSDDSPKFLNKTNRIPIVAWSGKAEHIVKNYQKGDKVRIMGHLRTREIEILDNKKFLTFEIVVKDISLIRRPSRNLD